jgi:hypothetical protein
MTKQNGSSDKKGNGGLFIPTGFLIGFGIGFLVDNIPAGMFIGLGAGFLLFALTALFKK